MLVGSLPMLTTVHSLLRRHRRLVSCALAVLGVCSAVLAAHTVVMSDGMTGDHAVGDAAALCVAVGSALAVAGVAVLAARRPVRRPLWLLAAVTAPKWAFASATCPFPVRAGPPGAYVLRL